MLICKLHQSPTQYLQLTTRFLIFLKISIHRLKVKKFSCLKNCNTAVLVYQSKLFISLYCYMNLLEAYIEVLCGVLPLHFCHHQIHVKLWGQKLLKSVPLLTVVAPDLEHCFQLWQLLCQSVIIENGKMQLYFWQWEMVLIYLNLSKVSFQVI